MRKLAEWRGFMPVSDTMGSEATVRYFGDTFYIRELSPRHRTINSLMLTKQNQTNKKKNKNFDFKVTCNICSIHWVCASCICRRENTTADYKTFNGKYSDKDTDTDTCCSILIHSVTTSKNFLSVVNS